MNTQKDPESFPWIVTLLPGHYGQREDVKIVARFATEGEAIARAKASRRYGAMHLDCDYGRAIDGATLNSLWAIEARQAARRAEEAEEAREAAREAARETRYNPHGYCGTHGVRPPVTTLDRLAAIVLR